MRGFDGTWWFRVAEDAAEFGLQPAPVEVAVAFAEDQIIDWLTWLPTFTGVTSTGGRIRIYYRHTEFMSGTYDDGEEWSSPISTEYRYTLDGEPMEVEAFSRYGFTEATIALRTDRGTIVAVADDNGALNAFPDTRRRFREDRPIGGWWYAEPESHERGDEHWTFVVSVFNDHVVERLTLRLPVRIADQWMEERPSRSIEEMAADYIAGKVRSMEWTEIVERAPLPFELLWTAFPPDRRREDWQTLVH
jgi:hypothetical protein